jgi:hypothetical protein
MVEKEDDVVEEKSKSSGNFQLFADSPSVLQ